MNKILSAMNTARHEHAHQKRETGEAFSQHPIRVCQLLREAGAPSEVRIAGLLHDVVEDTNMSIEDIEVKYGKKVGFYVMGVTKFSEQTKINYFEQIENCTLIDPWVIVIKLADRLDNLKTMQTFSEDRKNRFIKETTGVIIPIANKHRKVFDNDCLKCYNYIMKQINKYL